MGVKATLASASRRAGHESATRTWCRAQGWYPWVDDALEALKSTPGPQSHASPAPFTSYRLTIPYYLCYLSTYGQPAKFHGIPIIFFALYSVLIWRIVTRRAERRGGVVGL